LLLRTINQHGVWIVYCVWIFYDYKLIAITIFAW